MIVRLLARAARPFIIDLVDNKMKTKVDLRFHLCQSACSFRLKGLICYAITANA